MSYADHDIFLCGFKHNFNLLRSSWLDVKVVYFYNYFILFYIVKNSEVSITNVVFLSLSLQYCRSADSL